MYMRFIAPCSHNEYFLRFVHLKGVLSAGTHNPAIVLQHEIHQRLKSNKVSTTRNQFYECVAASTLPAGCRHGRWANTWVGCAHSWAGPSPNTPAWTGRCEQRANRAPARSEVDDIRDSRTSWRHQQRTPSCCELCNID